jgi:hypothetical protein
MGHPMLLGLSTLLCAVVPAATLAHSSGPLSMMARSSVLQQHQQFSASRRVILTQAVAAFAATVPSVSFAVAPPSPQQMLKSRAVYGSRVYRLQGASPAVIIDEKNCFTLFITGVYGSTADKATKKELEKLEKAALTAASKGDAATAQQAVKDFVVLGRIEELDSIPGTYFNAKTPCDRAGLQCGKDYKGYMGSRMEDL